MTALPLHQGDELHSADRQMSDNPEDTDGERPRTANTMSSQSRTKVMIRSMTIKARGRKGRFGCF